MLYPTIDELTKGEYNRYELALATAKCARMVTSEYVRQREVAERSMTGNKDTDRPLMAMIDSEYRDEKAVKTAVHRLKDGKYEIARLTPEELLEEEAREAAAMETRPIFGEIPDELPDDGEEEGEAVAAEETAVEETAEPEPEEADAETPEEEAAEPEAEPEAE